MNITLKKALRMIRFIAENEGKAEQTALKEVLIKYGISNIPVDCFHVDGYKYSNLEDAIAQAKRVAAPGK